MKNIFLKRGGFYLGLLLLVSLRSIYPETSEPPPRDPNYYENEILAFERADRTNPPPRDGIVFVGASSVRYWTSLAQDFPGLPVYNRGFGGSQMEDLVHYADRIVIPYQPRAIVVRAGGNDIYHGKSPERVLRDFQEFVRKVRERLPNTKIFYTAIYPDSTGLGPEYVRTNNLIRDFIATQTNMAYIDIATPMTGPDGRVRPGLLLSDDLHPSVLGFQLMARTIRPHLTPNSTSNENTSPHRQSSPQTHE